MSPVVHTDDLLDAGGVAALLGLAHPNSVHTYLRRYDDMPRPVVERGRGRLRLWWRPELERWLATRRPAPSGDRRVPQGERARQAERAEHAKGTAAPAAARGFPGGPR